MIQRVLAVGVAVLLCGSALAEQITIKNAGFETTDPVLAVGGWTNALVDWSGPPAAGDSFIEYIDTFSSEGTNHLGIQNNEEVSQDLGVPALPNTTYILTVGVGRRNATFTVEGNQSTFGLYAGGDNADGGTLLGAKTYDAFPLADLTFVDDSLTVTTGDTVPAGNLVISLRTTGPQRAHFDNIRLEAIPEPSALALAMLGLIGVAARLRRR
jgi:hypothetical protein